MSEGVLRLYKFYGADRGLENLKQRRLKISTLNDLNDPFEFRGLQLPNARSREIWEVTRTKLFDSKGVICFCKTWSNPVIWSHYGENHRGLALGFDVPAKITLPVRYRKHRAKFSDLSHLPTNSLMRLVKTALATKFIHWEYEDEIRVFVDAKEKCAETGLFFKSFDSDLKLREVILGPEAKLSASAIRDLLCDQEMPVITSRLAFRSYRVVRQKEPKLQK